MEPHTKVALVMILEITLTAISFIGMAWIMRRVCARLYGGAVEKAKLPKLLQVRRFQNNWSITFCRGLYEIRIWRRAARRRRPWYRWIDFVNWKAE